MTNEQLKNRTQQIIDAIPVLREKEYGWAEVEKMLNEILIELDDSPWHTGTPTEDGWYLVAYECIYDCKNKGKIEYFTLNIVTDEDGSRDYRGRASDDVWKAVAWQKIEPYKENIND